MNRSRLLIVAACVLWSLGGLFGKLILLPGPTIACYRVLIAGAVLLPFLKWHRVRFRPAMAVMVLCFTTMNVSYITVLTLTTAANAIFLQSVVSAQEADIITLIEPMLVTAAAFLAVGEVPAVATMVGGSVILAAVLLRFIKPSRTTATV